jgi:monoamine oxidase
MREEEQIVVIGAGAAGLAAAVELGHAGLPVALLEARKRIGGRIFTHRESASAMPIELGAEFIHGCPPEIWELLERANVKATEVEGDSWCHADGHLSPCSFFAQVERILEAMDERSPDESFLQFLERCFPNPSGDSALEQARDRAIRYVTGFNAADPAQVGVHWLVQGMLADERIDGHRSFRPEGGYATLLEILRRQLVETGVRLQTDTVVDRVRWKPASAEVEAHSPAGPVTVSASRVLVTLPLGVWKASPGEAGAVAFAPELPPEKLDALNEFEMGKVMRVVLRFRHRWWSDISSQGKNLAHMGFLFSRDEWFPTWWTSMPENAPIITGWAPFRSGEQLSGQESSLVVRRALDTLAQVLPVNIKHLETQLEAAYFHDWQSDPFSRGAYSYGKVGADGRAQILAAPVQNTLFFAGEATDTSGHTGTVHGAIASGRRAAGEILRAIGGL